MRSTKYILGFATIVCLVCSVVVSGSAVSLKDLQTINKQLDQKKKGSCAMDTYKKTAVREMFSALFKKTFKKTVELKHAEFEISIFKQIQCPAASNRLPPDSHRHSYSSNFSQQELQHTCYDKFLILPEMLYREVKIQ